VKPTISFLFIMKIALIGGTGFVGSAVLKELLSRGHQVTALARNPEKYTTSANLAVVRADAYDASQVSAAVRNHDAVVSAFNPGWKEPEIRALYGRGHAAIVEGVKNGGVKRYLEVGGAGSLFVAPGIQGVDTPQFPAEWREGALGARDALESLRQEAALEWTFISPPANLHPGERTGRYRLGADDLLMDGDLPAGISVDDLALAIVDELEKPQHVRRRFTVASA
jgi:putative NADH-flavin reductase